MAPPVDTLRLVNAPAPTGFTFVTTVDGGPGAAWGALASPVAVVAMPDARVFLADRAAGTIHRFDRRGGYVGGVDGPSRLVPTDLAEHGLRLFVLDAAERRVLRFTVDGVYRDVFLDLDAVARQRSIDPSALAIDRDGRLAVADRRNHEVLVTGPFLDLDVVVAERGTRDGQVDRPVGVAFGLDGILYVVDRGNRRVQAFDRNGVFLAGSTPIEGGGPDLSDPAGIACDRFGNVYVADAGAREIVVFAPDLRVVARLTGDAVGVGAFGEPIDCAVSPEDRLYVTDAERHALVVFDIVLP